MATQEVIEQFQNIDSILETTRFGLHDLLNDPNRRAAGLHNFIVHARTVTLAIQALKHRVDGFDEWYAPFQQAMREDPVMRQFYETRNKFAHTAQLQGIGGNSHYIESFSTSELKNYPKPPGATTFFIGDENGGAGWLIPTSSGDVKHYITLPPNQYQFHFHFSDDAPPEVRGLSVMDAAKIYFEYLEKLVATAKAHFMPPPKRDWAGRVIEDAAEAPQPPRPTLRRVK